MAVRLEQTAQRLVQLVLKNLKESEFAFSLYERGRNFHAFHTRFPVSPPDAITIVVILSEKDSDPLVIAAFLDGWVDLDSVKKELNRSLSRIA